MTLGHVNLRSRGDRRGSRCISFFCVLASWTHWDNPHWFNSFLWEVLGEKARDIMRPKITLSKEYWSKLYLDQKEWAEIRSWGFKLNSDKTVAISTQSNGENGRGAKHAFENNLTAQWPGLAEPVHSVSEYAKSHAAYRSGLAVALAVYSLHLKTQRGRFCPLSLNEPASVKCYAAAVKRSMFWSWTDEWVSFHPVECCVDVLAQWFIVIHLSTRSRVTLPTTFALVEDGGGGKMTSPK